VNHQQSDRIPAPLEMTIITAGISASPRVIIRRSQGEYESSESLHNDLAGQGSRDGRGLPGRQQRDRKAVAAAPPSIGLSRECASCSSSL